MQILSVEAGGVCDSNWLTYPVLTYVAMPE
jgi:hypothetical protein